MPQQIGSKIVGYAVKTTEEALEDVVMLSEDMKRPHRLDASVYELRSQLSEHPIFITISDITLNAGTRDEVRCPYEVFINTKDMPNYQWVVALTRLISAAWQKGGEYNFISDELMEVFDPRGGYFKKGRYVNSLVAEIGEVIH